VSAVLLAALAAIGFSGTSLLALLGGEVSARGRSYSAAFAAGILLALAFVDLFPEGLELAGEAAIAGFVGGFVLLFLTEVFTRAHTHHSPEERLREHALGPFVLGLAIHNFADGFVLGVGAKASAITSWLVGLGVLVHQMPVGISLAAVFVAARAQQRSQRKECEPAPATVTCLHLVLLAVSCRTSRSRILPKKCADSNRWFRRKPLKAAGSPGSRAASRR
jgi:zinc transporter ZupT